MARASVLDDARRRELLAELQDMGSDADAHSDIVNVFLALPSHAAALQPSKLIVRGERGAGKTALFHMLRQMRERKQPLSDVFPEANELAGHWVEGFGERGKTHPSADVLDQFGTEASDNADVRAFWFGHLIGVLSDSVPDEERPPASFIQLWREHRTDPAQWVDTAKAELGALTAWLDRFDDRRVVDGQWVFVTYDHLDKLGITRPGVRRRFASTLLAMWLSLSNRYERLRGKVFLREDLFQSSLRSSTDASKLETRSVSLYWSTEDLYRLLIRHMSAATGLRNWLNSDPVKIPLRVHKVLGWLPPPALPEDGKVSQRSFAEKLAGELMGKGVKKGYTHRWIPNHLQDAHRAIVPRSILNIVRFSAQWAVQNGPRAKGSRLLAPTELHAALESTSKYRAQELEQEHLVVNRIENLKGLVLLAKRREVVARLGTPRPHTDDSFGTDGEAVLDELVSLGVLRIRDDGRIDVPDIYRFGFGIKRKGGVARPR